MERKGILYLFTVPVSLFFYAQALMTLIGQYIGSAHARAELADF